MELYYAPYSPPSRAVRLVAEYIGVSLKLKLVDVIQGEHMKPEYGEINPDRRVPFLVDGDFKLGESRAIMTYLVEKYGNNSRILPSDPKTLARVKLALHFEVGTLFKWIRAYYFPVVFSKEKPSAERYEKLKEAVGILDTMLDGKEYIAARNLTIADISIITSITTAEAMGYDLSKYKNITAWLARCEPEMPGYRRINLEGVDVIRKLAAANNAA